MRTAIVPPPRHDRPPSTARDRIRGSKRNGRPAAARSRSPRSRRCSRPPRQPRRHDPGLDADWRSRRCASRPSYGPLPSPPGPSRSRLVRHRPADYGSTSRQTSASRRWRAGRPTARASRTTRPDAGATRGSTSTGTTGARPSRPPPDSRRPSASRARSPGSRCIRAGSGRGGRRRTGRPRTSGRSSAQRSTTRAARTTLSRRNPTRRGSPAVAAPGRI